ncbi:MAG: hypothetical protein ACHP7A_05880 [Caulobacterales bacterium]|jgi:hypothetical protein
MPSRTYRRVLFATLVLLAIGPPALAQPAAPAGSSTAPQGGLNGWATDPHMHAFYAAAVSAFAQGPDKVDVDAFESKCFAIFRDFGAAHGIDPARMQERTKLLPRQVVQIVREDPKVLDSYENFVAATAGPP